MILLDTDHISVVKYVDHPRSVRFTQQLQAASVGEDVATTIITVEEQFGGWLARIRREANLYRKVEHYRQLGELLDLYCEWQVEQFDDSAADQFLLLRSQRLRIGTQDLKIAAIALSRGALLLSANLRDFERVPGLRVENWIG